VPIKRTGMNDNIPFSTQVIIQKLDQILALLQATPKTTPRTRAVQGVSTQTDEQWLDSLGKDAAYDHVPDVRKEYAKARIWCDTNGRQCTRKFFVAWLNRVPKEMNVIAMKVAPTMPPPMYKPVEKRPQGEAPPKEVAEKLSKLLGKEMSF